MYALETIALDAHTLQQQHVGTLYLFVPCKALVEALV